MAWLRRPDAPASTTVRLVYYLSVKAWHHATADPIGASRTMLYLYRHTPRATPIALQRIAQRLRRKLAKWSSG